MTDGTKSSWGGRRHSRNCGQGCATHFSTLFKDKRPNFMTLIHFVSHRELIILKFFKHHGIKFIEKNIHCWYQNLKTEDYSLPTFQLFNRPWI